MVWDVEYKCVSWAAGEDHRWWWPGPPPFSYWPQGIERVLTSSCFEKAFGTLGYARCDDGQLQAGYEKVAIYVDSKGTPTHMARQLESGKWTSKLGGHEDIEHATLEILEGSEYGRLSAILWRFRK